MIDIQALENFAEVTGFDLVPLFTSYIEWSDVARNSISQYYAGATVAVPVTAFTQLHDLSLQTKEAVRAQAAHRTVLTSCANWDILEELELMLHCLDTTLNANRFLRSGVNRGGAADPLGQYTLSQGQTLEEFSRKNLGAPADSWQTLALSNQLREEDYTPQGGTLLQATLQKGGTLFVNSVLDYVTGDNVQGQDLDRKIQFDGDDLKILTHSDTFNQAVGILGQLKMGDNPQYPTHGIGRSLMVGASMGGVTFPSLLRQLTASFGNDDTIKSFAIRNIRRVQDALYVDFEVENRLNEIKPRTLVY